MSEMRCLAVRQPWAQLITDGVKTVELRTWPTHYRGSLVIVAAVNRARERLDPWAEVDGPRGAVVAVTRLVDVRPATRMDSAGACAPPCEGEWAWVLHDVRPVKPIPTLGQLGLWAPSPSLKKAIARALRAR